jgi:hypothetical protein
MYSKFAFAFKNVDKLEIEKKIKIPIFVRTLNHNLNIN